MARIYLDYASLTPVDPRVIRVMGEFSAPKYANPASIYREGVEAKRALESARKVIAGSIHALADEIIFTGSGTEANNLALFGALKAVKKTGQDKPHIIVSSVEHSSIMDIVDTMSGFGVEVTKLGVDKKGRIDIEELRKSIKPNTFMVSIMTLNNEIGNSEPVREIAKAVRWARANITKTQYPLFHTDAAQAQLLQELFVEQLGVDLMTLDSGKIYGPRGIGALFIKRETPIEAVIYGGGQEKGLRSGTENLPAIMGFAKAVEIAAAERKTEQKRILDLARDFLQGLKKLDPGITANSEGDSHIVNVSIPNIDNEFFVLQLDAFGVTASTKSSCLHDSDESYVLRAIGVDSKTAVRFSFGRYTKPRHVRKALKIIATVLAKRQKPLKD